MTRLTIATESPLIPEATALIEASQAALLAAYSPDECFSFTARELAQPLISFFMAREKTQPMGCVALVDCQTYGEVKRLFVPESARGKGVAQTLMRHLEQAARDRGLPMIRLETGTNLAPAVALYQKHGYRKTGPFGDYTDHPASLFMEKPL